MKSVLVCLCLALQVLAVVRHANLFRRYEADVLAENPVTLRDAPTYWMQMHLDNFDQQETRTFLSRYYVNEDNYVEGGPVLVYVGGEAALSAGSVLSGEIVETAKVHGGLVVGLEHRYYGESQPFDTFDTPNLQWLTSQQALADLARFVRNITQEYSVQEAKWFVFGGSYPGALSAWFRLKYPQLVVGSVASSAPVLAKANFYEYDQVVAASAGPTCSEAIREVTAAVQEELFINETTNIGLKTAFGCTELLGQTELDNVGFLYVLADAVSYAIQYTSELPGPRYHLKEELCSDMENTEIEAVDRAIKFVTALFGKLNTTCADFTTTEDALKDTTVSASVNQRQWYYQSCTEFGYFQTAPPTGSLRSPLIDLKYHLDLCEAAYGIPLVPDVDFINEYYGGNDTHSSHIFFVNGGLDPWKALSVTSPLSCCPEIQTRVIAGTSHCSDLYAPSDSDLPSLIAARKEIASYVSQWLPGPSCPSGQSNCNNECVDLNNDPSHCGACNTAVGENQYCSNGAAVQVADS